MAQSSVSKYVELNLRTHPNVPGVSVALINNETIEAFAVGYAQMSSKTPLETDHILECASLSKTVASAFAIQYFANKGIQLSTSVNEVLAMVKSPWRIQVAPNSSLAPSVADEVTLSMLMNHTALGLHYVYGIPLSDNQPTPLDLLTGVHLEKYGYPAVYLERTPGVKFSYSGGGYLVLQHILESFENASIEELMRPFLDACDMGAFSFDPYNRPSFRYASGHVSAQEEVQPHDSGRLAFPALAAGGLGTPSSLAQFLIHLGRAYKSPHGSGAITHATAVTMLGEGGLIDAGAMDFMLARAGCGVFVATCSGQDSLVNRFMLHQAANNGFRGVYMYCYDGPDAGKGFVILCNGDHPAVLTQCDVAKFLLRDVLRPSGVDFNQAKESFDMSSLTQETIVNQGLKELVMTAFQNNGVV